MLTNHRTVSRAALGGYRNLSTIGLPDEPSLLWETGEDLNHQWSKQKTLETTGTKGFWFILEARGVGLRDANVIQGSWTHK